MQFCFAVYPSICHSLYIPICYGLMLDTFSTSLPGFIVGFREGLEAFLVVMLIIRFLRELHQPTLVRYVWRGVGVGVAISGTVGAALFVVASRLQRVDEYTKLWESGASLVAVALIIVFIVWMITHGRVMTTHIKQQVQQQLAATVSSTGIMLLAATVVAREGTEVVLFAFAGKYSLLPVALGIAVALLLVWAIAASLVKVNLRTIF